MNKTISDYVIIKKIGAGGQGTVFKVRRKSDRAVIALKILPLRSMNPRVTEDANREIEILKQLSDPTCNPSIVCYYNSYYDPKRNEYLIEMEYIDGVDMLDNLNNMRNTMFREVFYYDLLRIARDISKSLEYIHNRNVLHNDLKLENVMLNNKGEVKLIDFGMGCFTTIDEIKGKYCRANRGTPYYLAPEYLDNGLRLPASDMWALGIMLYIAVTGDYPYPEVRNLGDIITYLKSKPAPQIQTDNQLLNRIVNGLLVKDPSERLTANQVYNMINMNLTQPTNVQPVSAIIPPMVGKTPSETKLAGTKLGELPTQPTLKKLSVPIKPTPIKPVPSSPRKELERTMRISELMTPPESTEPLTPLVRNNSMKGSGMITMDRSELLSDYLLRLV